MYRCDKPCPKFTRDITNDNYHNYCICGWLAESHCNGGLHHAGNFGGILPCTGTNLCKESPEYKREQRLTALLDRLEAAVEKLDGIH